MRDVVQQPVRAARAMAASPTSSSGPSPSTGRPSIRFARALLAAGELRGRELNAVITAACSSG